ncbi:polysaccharide deacetylase family protein [Candidatus Bathyarchaeota archaeon]|nr:polysaccharide deacetylase family protein [Candidatus Bathyarchaeota archaeon]
MKLKHAAAISTTMVIVFGIAIVSPFFLRNPKPNQKVMLVFDVLDYSEVEEWCYNLSSILEYQNVKATVFIVGKVAENNPKSVSCFGQKIDVGSLTYTYSNLTSISDYSLQLEEVRKGKQAVDNAGNIYSRLFKAPFGSTDDNIYSLLSRCDILADFSYQTHYNLYLKDKFLRFEATSYNGSKNSANFISSLPKTLEPIIIEFDDTCSTAYIGKFISELRNSGVDLVNASEIAGKNLTLRGD